MTSSRLDDILPPTDPTAVPRVVTRQQAYDLGFTRRAIDHRVRTGRWQRILPRTFLTVDTLTWHDRQHAAVAFAGPHSMLSGAAALTDQGLRSVRTPATILVLVPPNGTAHSTRWVRVRRTSRLPEPALLPGPRRAPLARAVADAALLMRRQDDVRTLVAQAVRRRVCEIEELADELRSGPRRGSAFLRAAVDEVGRGAWSAPEARAATVMRRAGLPAFEQNAPLRLTNGATVWVDFLWRALRAVLEIDSDAHHALTGDADRTSDRHLWLTTDGFEVIHRTPRVVVTEEAAFVRDIGRWLDARSQRLAS